MNKYLFEPKHFTVLRKLGEGAQGYVLIVQEKKTKKQYAAKINKNQEDPKLKSFFEREISILIHLNNPTIVRFRGFSYKDFQGNNNTTILMDYMENKSLRNLLTNEKNGLCGDLIYNNTNRQIILAGIAYGMMILHKNNIIHRDLKPENILLDNNYYPVITDFGLSKFFDPLLSSEQSRCFCGTLKYMAPEIFISYDYNSKVDVFSFAMIMYEVITGRMPYEKKEKDIYKLTPVTFHKNLINGLRPEFDPEDPIKEDIKILIEKCWSNNIDERPTFQELFQMLSLYYSSSGIQDKNGNICDNQKYCLDDVNVDDLYSYIDKIIISNELKENKEDLLKIEEIFQQIFALSPRNITIDNDLPEKSKDIIQSIKKEFPSDENILLISKDLKTMKFNDVLKNFEFSMNIPNIKRIFKKRKLFNYKGVFELFSFYAFYNFIPIYFDLADSKEFVFIPFLNLLNHIIQISASNFDHSKYRLIAISCFVAIINIAVENNTIENYNDIVQEVSEFFVQNTNLPIHSDEIINTLSCKIFKQSNENEKQQVNLIEKIIFISSQNPGIFGEGVINSIIQLKRNSIIGLNPLCLRLFLHFANSLKINNFLSIMSILIVNTLTNVASPSNLKNNKDSENKSDENKDIENKDDEKKDDENKDSENEDDENKDSENKSDENKDDENDNLKSQYIFIHNDKFKFIFPDDLYLINKVTNLDLEIQLKSQNLYDHIDPELKAIVRIIEKIINLKKVYAQNFISESLRNLHVIELNLNSKESESFKASEYIYFKQCSLVFHLILSILKKFSNITLNEEIISTLNNKQIFNPRITYFTPNSNFKIINSLRDFIFKLLLDKQPQLFVDIVRLQIIYPDLFRESLCRLVSLYNKENTNENFSYLADVLIESLVFYRINSSSKISDNDYLILSIRKMLFKYLCSYLSNDTKLIKAFDSQAFTKNFFILLIEPPIRQKFIGFLEKYLLSIEFNETISLTKNLTNLSQNFINIFIFSQKLPQNETFSLIHCILDVLNKSINCNKKLASIFEPVAKVLFHILTKVIKSNKTEEKDNISIPLLDFLVGTYFEDQLMANDISLIETIMNIFMEPNIYQKIMDTFIQIISNDKITAISPVFIIKNYKILCTFVRVFLNTSYIYKVVKFISDLCSYSKENCKICHSGELDMLIINIINKWRKSTISFIDAQKVSEVYIIEKENEIIIDEKLLDLFLHLFYQISTIVSSIPIVNNYFSLMCPIDCTYLSQIHKNILNTLNKILISNESNNQQSFSDFLLNYCNVNLIIPLFGEIDFSLRNKSHLPFLINLNIEILSNLLNLGEKAQYSFYTNNGFFAISYLLQNSEKSHIKFDLYQSFYNLLLHISNKNLQMQLMDSILINIDLWSRAEIQQQMRIFKHWNIELYSTFQNSIDLIRNSHWFILAIHRYYKSDDKFYIDCRNNLFSVASKLSNENLPFSNLLGIIEYICLNGFSITERKEILAFLLTVLSDKQMIKDSEVYFSKIISFSLKMLDFTDKNDDIIIIVISIIIMINKYDKNIHLDKIMQRIIIVLLINQKYMLTKDIFLTLIAFVNSNHIFELFPFLCVISILGSSNYLEILLNSISTDFNYNMDINSTLYPAFLLFAFYSNANFYPKIINLLINIYKENWDALINSINIIGLSGSDANIFDVIKHDVLISIINQPDIKQEDALNLIKIVNDFILFRPENSKFSILNHYINSYPCEIFTGTLDENENSIHEFTFDVFLIRLSNATEQKFNLGYKMGLRFDQINGKWLDLDLAKAIVKFNTQYNFTKYNEIMNIWSLFIPKIDQYLIDGAKEFPGFNLSYAEFNKFCLLFLGLQQNHDQICQSVLNSATSFSSFYKICQNDQCCEYDKPPDTIISDTINKKINDKCNNSWKTLCKSLAKIRAPWNELFNKYTFNWSTRVNTFCFAFCPFKLHRITNLNKNENIPHFLSFINKNNGENTIKTPNNEIEKTECKLITIKNTKNALISLDSKSISIEILDKNKTITIPSYEIDDVFWVFKNHQYLGFQIFTKLRSNYFLIFNDLSFKIIPPSIRIFPSINISKIQITYPKQFLELLSITNLWMYGNISNFEYLMYLNILSGRSFNMISQYPIFPWVICDFSSSKLDFSNNLIYRDLSKPMGALDNQQLNELIRKRDESDETDRKSYLYESCYSNPSMIDYYLVRLEPFTTKHIENNEGKFADPSKIFRSMHESYENAKRNFFELIPEFFFCSEFLQNINKLNLGQFDQQQINDVILPPWANNSAFEFIYLHRKSLESEFVSTHLNEWIDLIWGYKQDGVEAQKANNTFRKEMYQKIWIDPNINTKDTINLQKKIGQIPLKLFDFKHPKRFTKYLYKSSIPAFNNPTIFLISSMQSIEMDPIEKLNNQVNHSIIKFFEVDSLFSADFELLLQESKIRFIVIDNKGNLHYYTINFNILEKQFVLLREKKSRNIKTNPDKIIDKAAFIDYKILCFAEQNSSSIKILNHQKTASEKIIDKKFEIVTLETNKNGWLAVSAEDSSVTIFNINYPMEMKIKPNTNEVPTTKYESTNTFYENELNSTTILSYRRSVNCIAINTLFDEIICGTEDNFLLFSRLDLNKAKVNNAVELKGRPQKIIITDGFGFVAVSITKIKNGDLIEKLVLFNINGTKIRSKKLDDKIRIVALEKALSPSSGLDFLIVADNRNYIYVFEAFYLNFGDPIFKCKSKIVKLSYIQEESLILAFCSDGSVSIIYYPITM